MALRLKECTEKYECVTQSSVTRIIQREERERESWITGQVM